MYMGVTHGMMSLEDMIAPLKLVSFSLVQTFGISNLSVLYPEQEGNVSLAVPNHSQSEIWRKIA